MSSKSKPPEYPKATPDNPPAERLTRAEMEKHHGKLPAKIELAVVGDRIYQRDGNGWQLLSNRSGG